MNRLKMNIGFRQVLTICLALILTSGICSLRVQAQKSQKLLLGDNAPVLTYSKWIKGTPIATLEKDQVYVLEFWATWCGPCIAAMPHLSDLADKYQGKATFISANVWEKTGEKPYESALPNVIRFVEGNAKNMRFNVIADNNAQDLFNNWLKAAGVRGIPSTFVLQNGKIVWIGHPMKLEEVLPSILDGSYDLAAARAEYESAQSAQESQQAAQMKLYKPLIDAREAKDYKRMLVVIDSMGASSPEMKKSLENQRMIALMHTDEAEALRLAKAKVAADPTAGADIALTLSGTEGLSKEFYQFGADQLKDFPNSHSMVVHIVAQLQARAGDYTSAVASQQKAIDMAKEELKNPEFEGRVFEYTITDYESKMKEYQSKIKK